MKITKNTTINKMFELGFTEMRFKQLIVNENEDIFTLEDFKKKWKNVWIRQLFNRQI